MPEEQEKQRAMVQSIFDLVKRFKEKGDVKMIVQ
jgi:hypothetical protein